MSIEIDTTSTVLVLVDLQNDNVHSEGAFASSGAPAHADEQELLADVGKLLTWARS